MITVEGLKAMPVDEPIGEAVVCDIECMANEGLQPFYQREFEPYEGVYRVNDCWCSIASRRDVFR